MVISCGRGVALGTGNTDPPPVVNYLFASQNIYIYIFVLNPSNSKRRRNPQKGHREAICPLRRAGEMTNNRCEEKVPLEKSEG